MSRFAAARQREAWRGMLTGAQGVLLAMGGVLLGEGGLVVKVGFGLERGFGREVEEEEREEMEKRRVRVERTLVEWDWESLRGGWALEGRDGLGFEETAARVKEAIFWARTASQSCDVDAAVLMAPGQRHLGAWTWMAGSESLALAGNSSRHDGLRSFGGRERCR